MARRELKDCKLLVSHMLGIRAEREGAWLQLSRWIAGSRGVFDNGGRVDPYDSHNFMLFRSIVAQALSKGASGMTSGMTPRNISWFKPQFTERFMEEASGGREWLDALDTRMKDCLAAGSFYQSIQQFNLDLIWSGCALLYCEKGRDSPLRFECQQVGSFCVGLDAENRLKTVCRLLRMTPAGMADLFGKDALCEGTRKLLETEPYCQRKVWHLVEDARDNREKPVDSLYWEDGGEDFLRKSAFYEMPFFYTVWNEGATPYGTGPGDECLADARQIDKMERYKLSGLAKLVDPPLAAPISMKDQIDFAPGGLNYVAGPELIRPIIELGPFASALQYLQNEINIAGSRIENGLMASIFASMPIDQRPANMSATEFLERKREALQQLGPVISAYEPNVLTPLLYRVARTLDREGLAPPPPRALEGYPLYMKIDFMSPMANALRQTGAEATRALIQDVANIFQATQKAEIFDKVDLDQAVDELAKGIGAPGSIIRADEDVQAMRERRQAREREQNEAMRAMRALQLTQGAQTVAANNQSLQARAQAGMDADMNADAGT